MTSGFEFRLKLEFRGTVLRNEPMRRHTSLRVGGPADWFLCPTGLEDLQVLLRLLKEHGMPFLVVGGGNNLLVRDGGLRGAVISLDRFDRVELAGDNLVRAEAGLPNIALVEFAADRELSGLEFLVGIPGRVGGALAMNAGAGGGAITDCLETLVSLKGGEVATVSRVDLRCGYRFLSLDPGEIILGASFRLRKGRGEDVRALMEEFLAHRRAVQQVGFPNAGSFFRNPPQGPAWRFIDAAGLRGVRVGGAQVSEVHANFLVNRGEATAADFIELAALVKEKVREKTGVRLEEEVRVVGEE